MEIANVLETVDEDLHAIKLFEYLNSISIFLEFSMSTYAINSVERDEQKNIVSAKYEVREQYIKEYLQSLPYESVSEVSEITLEADFNHEYETIKASVIISDNAGQTDVIEVT